MAFVDWNQNGKDDMVDNLIEYDIYRDVMGEDDNTAPSHYNGSSSGFVTFLIVISGLIIQALLYTVLDIEVENVPVIVMIILWVGIDFLIAIGASVVGILK